MNRYENDDRDTLMTVLGWVVCACYLMIMAGILAVCDPLQVTQNSNTTVGGGNGTTNPANCNMTWNYADNGRSGIIVTNIIGANSGSFRGTCSDGRTTGGTFTAGDTVDPCVDDTGPNTSTFTLACGYTQDIVFDS